VENFFENFFEIVGGKLWEILFGRRLRRAEFGFSMLSGILDCGVENLERLTLLLFFFKFTG